MPVNEEERNDPPFNGPSVVRVVHFINDKVQDEYPQRNERIHPNPFSIVFPVTGVSQEKNRSVVCSRIPPKSGM